MIIKFPEEATLIKRMEDACDEIDHFYHQLGRCMEVQQRLEQFIEDAESSLNSSIKRYAGIVGAANVPVRYLEYSTNVEVSINEEGEFIFLYKEEEESQQPSSET